LAASIAGVELLWGGIKPIASIANPQVLNEAAIPQPPGPGQAARRIASASSWEIAPTLAAACASYTSKIEMSRPW
jgi:hypothetical protein